MKTIKTYQCECGEDFYEDDVNCVNCRKLDKTKLKNEEVADIKYTMKEEKKYIKIPKDYFKEMKYEVKVPTFICSCGEEVLDTPFNRIQAVLSPTSKNY